MKKVGPITLVIGILAGSALLFGLQRPNVTVEIPSPPVIVQPAPPKVFPGPPTINIPKLDLKSRIYRQQDPGPAFWPVTGRPGGDDTIAIAGHRTTHTRPFYYLERLTTGDRIYIRFEGKMYAYEVTGRRILSAKQLHTADAIGHERLLLSACTPRGSAKQRIVVYALPSE